MLSSKSRRWRHQTDVVIVIYAVLATCALFANQSAIAVVVFAISPITVFRIPTSTSVRWVFDLFCTFSIFVLFCFVLFCFYYFHALCSLIAFFYLQACRRRNNSRQLFFRRTALNDTAVEAHFDCTSENDTYDNLFVHLRAPIMSAIQNQLELDGYVCMYVCITTGICAEYNRQSYRNWNSGWFMVFRNTIIHPLTKYIELDAAVVALKMTITSVGPNHQFRRHNRRIQFDIISICMFNRSCRPSYVI